MPIEQPKPDRLTQQAAVAIQRGRVADAAALLSQAIAADPHHLMALTMQAELALSAKDHAAASELTGLVLRLEPNFAPAWHHRAAAYWLAGQPAAAVDAARRAVGIQPPNPAFRLRLAQFAGWSGLGADAKAALGPLLTCGHHDPVNHAAAVAMLGELEIAAGRFEQAGPYLDQALRLQPGLDTARILRGMNQLRLGRFRQGWPDYATRERAAHPGDYATAAGQPWMGQSWMGQPLADKALLIRDDQGHGDAIQFFRYLPMLRQRGARVTWLTFGPLVRLLRASAPDMAVLDALPPASRFDYHASSTSLPRWLETELTNVPGNVPYVDLPGRRHAVESAGKQLRVGLVWSGDARHARDVMRSIPAELFLRLADVPGVAFHSLQHEVRPADLAALQARPEISRKAESAADFADTAGLIADLDLVIAVDTGVAHLAGAMGKPVWIILHVAPDWRWLTDRTDSPWYPTARLFRVVAADLNAGRSGSEAEASASKVRNGREIQASISHDVAGQLANVGPATTAGGQRRRATARLPKRGSSLSTSQFTAGCGDWDPGWGPVLARVAASLQALVTGR